MAIVDRVRSGGAEGIGTLVARRRDSREPGTAGRDCTPALSGQVSQGTEGTDCTTHRHCTVATSFAMETGSQAEALTQEVNETCRSAESRTGENVLAVTL